MPPRFGTDGIRGVANSELTPEFALALGRAAARHLAGSPLLVGRDTRRSGPMLQAALAAGLASEGRDVTEVGVVPSPGLAWLAASRGLPAAMISASHNPFEDNGIKLFGPGGTKLPLHLEVAVQEELDRLTATTPDNEPSGGFPTGTAVGVVTSDHGAVDAYADHLVEIARADGPRSQPGGTGRHVVVDCANGAASEVAPAVLGRLGVRHSVVCADPDGANINAGCGSTDLGLLRRSVVELSADLGIAFDGDADRLLAVDHRGEVVDGDQLIAMFAVDLAERGRLRGDSVVVTVLSNLGLRRALTERGIAVVATPVGDRHVADALDAGGYSLGGEQSGHLIFAEHSSTGDGILTGLMLLGLLERTGRSLADLAGAAMQRLPQLMVNVPVPAPEQLAEAAAVWAEVAAVEDELGSAGRVLLRASGTESCVRVMVEAPSAGQAEAVVARLSAVVERELGNGAANCAAPPRR